MTIHRSHPFADPEEERDPARRFRGRLGGGVTLWTAGKDDAGADWAGLTVSSLMVAPGDPARLLALLDPEATLTETIEVTHRAVVSLLEWPHRGLAEMFAGTAPAPGGAFAHADFGWERWGPRLLSAPTWAGVGLEELRPVGHGMLTTVVLDQVQIGPDDDPLRHRRGRWTH